MPVTQNVSVKDGDVLLLLGTVKGGVILRSEARCTLTDLPACV
jgi:hypothetical protein